MEYIYSEGSTPPPQEMDMECAQCKAPIDKESIILNFVTETRSLILFLCSQDCLIDQVAGSQRILNERLGNETL